MDKKSRRKLGARRYANYSQETLNVVVDLVRSKALSSYEAEKQFGIPRRTILNKCNNLHNNSIGRPQELSLEDERHIAAVVNVAAEFGSPLSLLDLRIVVYNYLEKNGKVSLFKGKMPGERWAHNFLKRHNFTQRATQNIKRSRASKTIEEITNYYENLETSTKDIPCGNIINFDETNLCDDPGSQKAIFKRGSKHPERVLNSSKSSVSIMFSVTADGECLPPYVVYKAEHLWSRWCEFGPPKARYNRTKSGWFDMTCFDDWFKTIVLPWANSRLGVKVLIGDNLASHLSVEVIRLCEENSIRFLFLPPNATHLTQPLDVAFFGPMKKRWREILLKYKLQNQNSTTINKCHFPQLLQELMSKINMTQSTIIRSGFAGSGIFPFDPSRVLRKIPVSSEEEKKSFDISLLEYLQRIRKSTTQTNKRSNKKLAVVAGKSISTEEAERHNKMDTDTNLAQHHGISKKKGEERQKKSKCEKDKRKLKSAKRSHVDAVLNTKYPKVILQPKSLKALCSRFINEFWIFEHVQITSLNDVAADRGSPKSNVHFLNQLSKTDPSNLPFTALHKYDLPKCLQTTGTKHSDSTWKNCSRSTPIETVRSKINIISDVIIKEGSFKIDNSFKNLQFQHSRLDKINFKGKKVWHGSKVITEEALRTKLIKKNKENNVIKSKETKSEPDKRNICKGKKAKTVKTSKKKTINKRKLSLKRKKHCILSESSSSENSFPELLTAETDNSDNETLDHYITECLQEQEKENFDPVPSEIPFGLHDIEFLKDSHKFNKGDWILVQFATKKSLKHFVGIIISLNSQIPTVKFLRKVKNSKHEKGTIFTYPPVEDVCTITHSDDIISLLPKPQTSRRGQVIFNVDFTRFNIQ